MRRFLFQPLPILCLLLVLPLFQGCGESETDPEAFFKKDYRVIQELQQNSFDLSQQFPLNFEKNHIRGMGVRGEQLEGLLQYTQSGCIYLWRDILQFHEAYSMEILMEFKQGSPPLPTLYVAFRDYIRQVALPTLDVFEGYLPGMYRYAGDEATISSMREVAAAYRAHALEVAAYLDGMTEAQTTTPGRKGIAAEEVFQPVFFEQSTKKIFENRSRGCPPFTGAIDLDAPVPPLTLARIEENVEAARDALERLKPLCEQLLATPGKELQNLRCRTAMLELERYLLRMRNSANSFRLFTQYESSAPEHKVFRIFPLFRLAYGGTVVVSRFSSNLCKQKINSDDFIYMPLPENIERIMRNIYIKMAENDIIYSSLAMYLTREMRAVIDDRSRMRDIVHREYLPIPKRILRTVIDSTN